MKNSSNKSGVFSQPDLAVALSSSNWHGAYSILLHCAAAAAVFSADTIPLTISLPVVILVIINARLMYRESRSTSSLYWQANNVIRVTSTSTPAQPSYSGTVSSRSLQCYLFVMLKIRLDDNTVRYHLVPRDAVSEQNYRRLRARLYLATRINSAAILKSD